VPASTAKSFPRRAALTSRQSRTPRNARRYSGICNPKLEQVRHCGAPSACTVKLWTQCRFSWRETLARSIDGDNKHGILRSVAQLAVEPPNYIYRQFSDNPLAPLIRTIQEETSVGANRHCVQRHLCAVWKTDSRAPQKNRGGHTGASRTGRALEFSPWQSPTPGSDCSGNCSDTPSRMATNGSKRAARKSPALARQISTIAKHRTQSSSPFSELIIRWSQVRILASPSTLVRLPMCPSAHGQVRRRIIIWQPFYSRRNSCFNRSRSV
jgi:hypothetical protein